MRLASFNVENLFDRAKALNQDTWAHGKPTLEKFAELNLLLGEVDYTPARQARMAELMVELGLEKTDKGPFVILRRNRGGLLRRPKAGGIVITATSRADWVGSLELVEEPVDEQAMRNTARVMRDVEADILAVIEAENRPALAEFCRGVVKALGGNPFDSVMLVDGNDERGIDVGLLCRQHFTIGNIRSHVDDRKDGKTIFSRDCAEYEVATPLGNRLLIMVNHFKSKGFGSQQSSNAKRLSQARRVKEIYKARIAEGIEYIAVAGDLNDTPKSDPLKPLLQETDLRDVSEVVGFDDKGFPGTYGSSGANNKIDYILLSPKLFAKLSGGGIFRLGMWPGSRPKKWETYEELKREEDAASDHGAVWADIDV